MKAYKALDIVAQQFEELTNKALDKIAETAQKAAQNTNKFKTSSNFKSSIIIQNGHFARTVIANKDYAYYLEYGNNQKGPYIYPVKAQALHFWINGKEIFTKRVRSHPGYYFMRDAQKKAISELDNIIKRTFNKLF